MGSNTLVARIGRAFKRSVVTPGQLAVLGAKNDPTLSAIVRAVQDRARASERAPLLRIEEIRDRLCESTEVVEIPDYGAGTPERIGHTRGATVKEVVGDACRNFSKPPQWAALLYSLVRELKPLRGVELGTCLGISTSYQATALARNGKGRLTSLEGAPAFAAIAVKNLESLGLSPHANVVVGEFAKTLPSVLAGGPVDYAFIDGHHDETATLGYFEDFLPHLATPAVLVFDDINWSAGMQRAWERISNDERVDVSLDLGPIGMCVVGSNAKGHWQVTL